ncbi:MAG: hypothetical protein COA54_06935 [Thiotrichaceae bacterium]|nr:MAG: hypothetical protein COA54_06935 [Thiotrichaceae bacterium]
MRIFKTRVFNRWAKGLLSDDILLVSAYQIAAGNFDASLGKKVYKKRIALAGKGKSGGARTIVAYQEGNNIFFVEGFTKDKKDNVTSTEKIALQNAANVYLTLSVTALKKAVTENKLIEIKQGQSRGKT